jgi:hypothetical protein
MPQTALGIIRHGDALPCFGEVMAAIARALG